MELAAPAKVNLFLDVLRRRENGYHEIRSIMVPVSLCDRIRLEPDDGIETVMQASSVPDVETLGGGGSNNNLTTRAALRLKEAAGYRGGARIHLEKHIPLGGGLGGGSADAAAVLIGLNALWKTGLSTADLARLAAQIGSDVPALVCGGAVCVEGIGEVVEPVFPSGVRARTEWWLVLVNPGFGVLTRDVYERYAASRNSVGGSSLTSRATEFTSMLAALRRGDIAAASGNLFNALEPTVFRKYPLLEMLAENLRRCGATGVLLSGSGSTVFAMARDQAHAEAVHGRIRGMTGGRLWSRVVKTLPDGVTGSTRPFGG